MVVVKTPQISWLQTLLSLLLNKYVLYLTSNIGSSTPGTCPYHIQNNCIAIVNNFVHSSLLLYEFIKAFLKAEGMRITVCLHLCYQKVLPTFSSNTKLWWINGTQCIFNLYSVSEVEHLFKELFLSFFFFSVHQISFS